MFIIYWLFIYSLFGKITGMKNNNYLSRFKKLTKNDIVLIVLMGLALFLGLYMSISMSVKISQGYTLFGDSNNHSNEVETVTTSSDYLVLSLYWVLTALVLGLFVYHLFFKKPSDEKNVVRKSIVDGKTVVVKENDIETKKDVNTNEKR